MTCVVLVRLTSPGGGLVNFCTFRVAGAPLRRATLQVQASKTPWQKSNVPMSSTESGLVPRSFTSGAALLSSYGVAGFLDGALELLSAHPALVIGDLDGALLDIRLRVLHPGELVQLAFDGRLAVAAAHVRYLQRLLGHHLSSLGRRFLYPQEPLDGGGELFYLLVGLLPMFYGLPNAVFDVVLEQDGAHLLQGRNHTGDLGEDIYTVGLLVHHPLHAPHLALDPPDPILEQLFVLGLYVAVGGLGSQIVVLCSIHGLLL